MLEAAAFGYALHFEGTTAYLDPIFGAHKYTVVFIHGLGQSALELLTDFAPFLYASIPNQVRIINVNHQIEYENRLTNCSSYSHDLHRWSAIKLLV
jgi:hypothetical protein